jgi:hypothetical protein
MGTCNPEETGVPGLPVLTDGGLELLDIAAKCRALLLSRMHGQGDRPGSIMAAYFRHWGLNECPSNPSNADIYPTQIAHVRIYAIDMPYVHTPRFDDTPKLWRRRIRIPSVAHHGCCCHSGKTNTNSNITPQSRLVTNLAQPD